MLKKIGLAVLAVLAAFAVVVATRPADYLVTRSAAIAAPPAVIYAQVADFHRWPAWSPWAKLDPAMKTTYSGAPSGEGAVYEWTGNDKVGEGRMTVTEARPGEKVGIKLEFLKPWASTSPTSFVLAPAAGKTQVTWTMAGHNNFVSKAFCLFMDMDKLIGGDFERGLGNLKSVSEAAAQAPQAAAPAPAPGAVAPAAAREPAPAAVPAVAR